MSSTKAELRAEALRRRDRVDPEVRTGLAARLAAIGPALVRDFAPDPARCVTSVYAMIGSEPDAGPLAEALHAAGVPLVLPVDWSHGAPLVYRSWRPGQTLAPGPLGIAEPVAEAPDAEPDVLFMPVAAFDRRGYRLGYGAGNVDRTVRALRRRKTVRVIGVAYALQEELFIPSEAHDEALDVVVTETAVLTCRP